MLEIINLRKTFNPGTVNEKTALDGVSLTLRDGDFVSVIGGNGAGNTYGLCTRMGYFPDILGIWQTNPTPWTFEEPGYIEMDGQYVWIPYVAVSKENVDQFS